MSGSATPATMLQIVTTGLQDLERLQPPVGQPAMQFYTQVMRRRTRFASQWHRVNFDNAADFGRRATVTLPPSAELISRAILAIQLPDIRTPQVIAQDEYGAVAPRWSWTNALGNAICSSVQMTLNNEVVEEFDSRLLEVLSQQEGDMDHFRSTNQMLQRTARGFNDLTFTVVNGLLYIVFPFWWNRGIGPQALPIQAMYKDSVQITCNFRPIQECVYTSTRSTTTNGLPSAAGEPGAAPLPAFAGCPFLDASGQIIPGIALGRHWSFDDAYWLVEYVSLEDREAAAFRIADLQIPFTQHLAITPYNTNGTQTARIPLNQGGLIRDITWVAQREDAPDYNAWFLFSRELSDISGDVWWPNMRSTSLEFGDGYIRPAFCDRRSDPITAAMMLIRGRTRFESEAPSLFRSLIPALGCATTPLIDRYVYRYDFGFWPSGGLAEALDRPADEVRGAANWSRLPTPRELVLTMATDCASDQWVSAGETRVYDTPRFSQIDMDFPQGTSGFRIEVFGASPSGAGNGEGAFVKGLINWQQLRQIPGYSSIWIRIVSDGSASILVKNGTNSYVPIAIAGGGGYGNGLDKGGTAGSAIETGFRGGPLPQVQEHTAVGGHGGGGGGRLGALPVPSNGTPAVGGPDGSAMPMTTAFLASLQSTGGSTHTFHGGDGYYGGGSGGNAGGGGGSMVSNYVSQTESSTHVGTSSIRITPLQLVPNPQLRFNIYVWLTRINMLRVTNGRAAVMFAA